MINKTAHEDKQVVVGRITVIAAMIIAIVIAPMLGIDKKGGFNSYRNIPASSRRVSLQCSFWAFSGKKQLPMQPFLPQSADCPFGSLQIPSFRDEPGVPERLRLLETGYSKDGSVLYEIPFI